MNDGNLIINDNEYLLVERQIEAYLDYLKDECFSFLDVMEWVVEEAIEDQLIRAKLAKVCAPILRAASEFTHEGQGTKIDNGFGARTKAANTLLQEYLKKIDEIDDFIYE